MEQSIEHKSPLVDTYTLHQNRPLSPHLSIYRMQLTSGLSILHRMTGAYLFIGLLILAWVVFGFVYFPDGFDEFTSCIWGNVYTANLVKVMLFGWTFSLFYHQLNGIRHLFWDAGKGFDLKTTYASGRWVMALSILLTFLCWALVYINAAATKIQ